MEHHLQLMHRMNSLPEKLSRYAAVAKLLVKYGRTSLPDEPVGPAPEGGAALEEDDDATALARDLEALGPTFVKFGQLLSTRPDLMPPAYLDALARLQDDVKPFPGAEARRIVEQELGVRVSKAFASFDEEPVAAASLGQVHRATLRDGRAVAVKVQRPDVAKRVASDLEALEEVARFLDRHSDTARGYDVIGTVAEFREAVSAELDYEREASHLQLIARNLEEFETIVVPQPVESYTTGRVLTMDFIPGLKVTSISPVARVDLDGQGLAATLIRAYLKQIIVDGVFHADPHPGNVFVTEDGRLGLLDLGMVGRISPGMQERLLKLLLAVSEGRGEEAADVAVRIGERMGGDEPKFRREIAALVGRFADESGPDAEIGRVFIQLAQVFYENGMRPPSDLTMLGKTLLNLDEVARALDPDFDVNEAIRRHGEELMQRRMRSAVTSTSVFSTLLEAKEFAEKLPGRVNRVLDSLAASELKMKVELIDEGAIIGGLQKVANRITFGLIVAALIIGAAMMMQIDTPFRILGYPGVAMILFLLAATGAGYLAVQILRHDHRPERK